MNENVNTETPMEDAPNRERALRILRTSLFSAFERKGRFPFLGSDYLFCDRDDVITFQENYEDGDLLTQAKALENGVFKFALVYSGDIHGEPAGERPIRWMSGDDFIQYALDEVNKRELDAETIHQTSALITLSTMDLHSALYKERVLPSESQPTPSATFL